MKSIFGASLITRMPLIFRWLGLLIIAFANILPQLTSEYNLSTGKPVIQLAPEGDILAIDTGAADRVGSADFGRHASLSVAAAEWLVAQELKLGAVDMPTPDVAIDKRPAGFIWPVHRTLLRDGVLIAEMVTNLRSLAGRRAEFMFCALNITDCDGAPARVLARPIAN